MDVYSKLRAIGIPRGKAASERGHQAELDKLMREAYIKAKLDGLTLRELARKTKIPFSRWERYADTSAKIFQLPKVENPRLTKLNGREILETRKAILPNVDAIRAACAAKGKEDESK